MYKVKQILQPQRIRSAVKWARLNNKKLVLQSNLFDNTVEIVEILEYKEKNFLQMNKYELVDFINNNSKTIDLKPFGDLSKFKNDILRKLAISMIEGIEFSFNSEKNEFIFDENI